MTSISLEDRECGFVLEHPVLGRFSQLLSRLDIRLPAELPLDDMVRWGWLIPDLRLPLSASFVRSWKHFATYGLDRTICSEDAPLDLAWYRAATLPPDVPGSTCTGVWWEHPFESPSYPAGWATPLEPF